MAMTFHITNFAHVSCLHFIFAYMYHPRWEEGQEAQRPRRTDLTGGTAGKKHRDHVGDRPVRLKSRSILWPTTVREE